MGRKFGFPLALLDTPLLFDNDGFRGILINLGRGVRLSSSFLCFELSTIESSMVEEFEQVLFLLLAL